MRSLKGDEAAEEGEEESQKEFRSYLVGRGKQQVWGRESCTLTFSAANSGSGLLADLPRVKAAVPEERERPY